MLRAPGELGLGRAYVLGLIDTDDIDKALRIVDTFEAPKLSPGADRPPRRGRRPRLRADQAAQARRPPSCA